VTSCARKEHGVNSTASASNALAAAKSLKAQVPHLSRIPDLLVIFCM
jgi:hypothetical protein